MHARTKSGTDDNISGLAVAVNNLSPLFAIGQQPSTQHVESHVK